MENAKSTELFVVNPQNRIYTGDTANHLTRMSVWGGVIANCGEDRVSELVYQSRDTLEVFLYYPRSTKGGVMVRPLYFQGNRCGRVVFSVLTELTMPWNAIKYTMSLQKFGWITPKLKSLTILHPSTSPFQSVELSSLLSITQEAPELEIIRIGIANYSDLNNIEEYATILPAVSLSWDKKRLLLLAMAKESHTSCPLAKLPKDTMRDILMFCSRNSKIIYSTS
mmetsp:Transcript_14815/g.22306  ORF Transcript_14815/g.22306 Transcript_14815/m.22306 type:complete len:224 (-) Transcript_14815:126-797(-)